MPPEEQRKHEEAALLLPSSVSLKFIQTSLLDLVSRWGGALRLSVDLLEPWKTNVGMWREPKLQASPDGANPHRATDKTHRLDLASFSVPSAEPAEPSSLPA